MTRAMKDSGVEWIGRIPNNWDIRKFKYCLQSNDGGLWGNDPSSKGDNKVVLRSTEQTVDGKWCIENPAVRDFANVDYKNYRIMPNDLIMTKSSGSELHIGKTTLADDYFIKNECYYSNFLQRLRVINVLPRFMWYVLNSSIAREQFAYYQNSTSGLGNINSSIIDLISIPYPSIQIQTHIVNFLDSKCQEIDNVLVKTRSSIEEYKKLKQAIITKAVTKGIRKNRKMKDSGIEWIKQIPEDWEIVPAKSLFKLRKEKARDNDDQLTASQSMGIINQKLYMELTGQHVVTVEKDFDILKHVEPGDFIISMRSFQGGIEYSSIRGCISSAYVMLIPDSAKVFDGFYKWLFKSALYINALQGTSNLVRDGQALRYSNFAQVPLCFISLNEQKEISYYLDDKCTKIDILISQKEQLISELESYKKSLIYEYVTGKKEVPMA